MRDQEFEAVIQVARLMLVAARTAPKAKGIDSIEATIITGDGLSRLAEKLRELSRERGYSFYERDARNVEASDCVVVIGARAHEALGMDCGMCGYSTCAERVKAWQSRGSPMRGPFCEFKVMDLGIAVGSAVKLASSLNVDNRVMYSVGDAVVSLGLLPRSTLALGIPLAARGKSPYFDRRR